MNQAIKWSQNVVKENRQDKSEVKLSKKIKATIYLDEEAEQAFAELYAKRYLKDRKTDRSMIACEAILDLHKRENRSEESINQEQ